MKRIKKVMALVIAAAMVMGMMSVAAVAAPGDLSVNSTLTVTGLDEGDKVSYYKVLKWDPSATNAATVGWTWGEGVNNPTSAISDIIGTTDGSGAITDAIASDLASHLGTAAGTNMPVGSDGKWTVSDVEAGLYMVIVTPATSGTVYNPIFVAANFYGNGEDPDTSNSIAISAGEPSYANNAMAKKSTIPLEKKAKGKDNDGGPQNGAYTTDVGEEVDFEVTTTIPKFGENYTNPVFKLVDTLTGLQLTTDPVVKDSKGATLVAGTDYTLNKDSVIGDATYTISFTKDYLQNKNTNKVGAAGEDITVTYTAKVTDTAEKIINQDKNTVDLIFSNAPTDTEGKGLLRDETNHFTFSIDANLIGDEYSEESSTEAIKVGLDKEGNPILSEQSYKYNNGVKHSALEGATFELLNKDGSKYTNALNPGGITVVSDATGRINIKGLDIGEYKLHEVSAPAGYIKMQNDVPVVISATITENVEVKDEVDNAGNKVQVTYKTNQLESYSVTIGGSSTTYTITNSKAETIKTSRNHVSSSDSELVNTKGVELPSTGGIGTTIFYVIGAILVLGAGVLLVTRRRMNMN